MGFLFNLLGFGGLVASIVAAAYSPPVIAAAVLVLGGLLSVAILALARIVELLTAIERAQH